MNRHWKTTVLTATAAALGALGVMAAPADADGAGQHIWVSLNADGTAAKVSSTHVHPGLLKMTLIGGAHAGFSGTVVSLHSGTTLSHFLTELTTAASQNSKPSVVAAAIRDIDRTVTAYGGGDTLPGGTVTDTITLPRAATYYLTNVSGSGQAVSLAKIDADGAPVDGDGDHDRDHRPGYSATVTLGDENRDVITVAGRMPTAGTVRVTNDGDVIHLLQMTKVADGVTDAQVQQEYDMILAGQKPSSDPAGLFSPPTVLVGSDASSPEKADFLTYSVPKGTYLLQCFVPDEQTGMPHAFMGMHKVVVIS